MSTSVPPTSASERPSAPKTPFLAAAALFVGMAVLIGALSIRPLGAAELLGLLACTAAAAVFATIPFTIDLTRNLDAHRVFTKPETTPAQASAEVCHQSGDKSVLDPEVLAASIATTMEARIDAHLDTRLAAALPAFTEQLTTALSASLAAAEETRRAEIQAAIAATTPPRIHDADTIAPPASAAPGSTAAKPRLGRGLLGLMHAPSALTAKPTTTDDDRAAA